MKLMRNRRFNFLITRLKEANLSSLTVRLEKRGQFVYFI